jgi:hypothetical protein
MKPFLIAVLLTLSAAAPASDFDYGLVARKVAKDVYAYVGRTEDFTMAKGGNIVNSGFIVAPEGVVVIVPVTISEYRRSVGHLFPAAEQEASSNATLH